MANTANHETWSSTTLFILSAVGSAVGLGNIWRFPYLAGENGGGAFVLIYLLCVTFIALPILIGEIMLGRMGRQSPINTMRNIAINNGKSAWWGIGGWLAVIIAFMVMTFYSVVAGWALDFGLKSAMGTFSGLGKDEIQPIFDGLLADPLRLIVWHTVFTALTVYIVSRGLNDGIESAIKWLMPALFTLLIGMVIYSMVAADFMAGLAFMLKPDFSKVTTDSFMLASSQAFFSVTIGAGAMMIYGAYLPDNVSIPRTTAIIVFADAGVAIFAGMAIFPIVFSFGLQPDGGPGLVFVTLPIAFGKMFGGSIIGTAFFLLLAIAALTSLIATLEPIVAWAEENRGIKRKTTTIIIGLTAWVLGFGSVLSFNYLADFHPLGFLPLMEGKTIFDLSEYISITILLPISGLLIALFVGWNLPDAIIEKELAFKSRVVYSVWRFFLRWLAPAVILVILFFNVV
ncbi:MAG: sodium-dependent transporter [Gammaproteobacteria bacterium]|nr:sodium-dependent transporter [Gammaproteobacteria bacterium]